MSGFPSAPLSLNGGDRSGRKGVPHSEESLLQSLGNPDRDGKRVASVGGDPGSEYPAQIP